MKKIKSLFKRDYDEDRLVYNEVVEGSEWVLSGYGLATEKFDGTACMIKNGELFKRYDRRPTNNARRKMSNKIIAVYCSIDFKPAPEGWVSCEEHHDPITGHWPGWIPIGDGPEDKYHREGYDKSNDNYLLSNGTYELVGPKIQNNPYKLEYHILLKHGVKPLMGVPRDFDGIKKWLGEHHLEGIVWHHPDGRMVKIKRRDFGFPWPKG